MPVADSQLDPDVLRKLVKRLRGVRVTLSKDPDAADIRAKFAEIRSHRNEVNAISIKLRMVVAERKARLGRVLHEIETRSAEIIETNRGMLGVTNDRQRKARIRTLLKKEYDQKSSITDELLLLEEVAGIAKAVLDDLRLAFDEASRSLSSLEFEFKVQKGL